MLILKGISLSALASTIVVGALFTRGDSWLSDVLGVSLLVLLCASGIVSATNGEQKWLLSPIGDCAVGFFELVALFLPIYLMLAFGIIAIVCAALVLGTSLFILSQLAAGVSPYDWWYPLASLFGCGISMSLARSLYYAIGYAKQEAQAN